MVPEILGGAVVGAQQERAVRLRRKRHGKQQKIKEAQKVLEKHDSQFQQWKEEAKKKQRAVELQEQAEVLAKVMKEQFDQTKSALSPSLSTPPQFPLTPPGVPSVPLLLKRKEDRVIYWEHLNFAGLKRNLLHKVSFSRNGVTKDQFIQTLGEQFGDRRLVAALGEFITRHGGDIASKQ